MIQRPPSSRPDRSSHVFHVSVALLILMAAGLPKAARRLSEATRKQAVPIRRRLELLDVSKLSRFRRVPDHVVAQKADVETDEKLELALNPVSTSPINVGGMELLVHYYTQNGRAPVIAHTPEICYRQSGFTVEASGNLKLAVRDESGATTSLPARWIHVAKIVRHKPFHQFVIYVLYVNGKFFGDREMARIEMAKPWNRRVYYAKIECAASFKLERGMDDAMKFSQTLLVESVRELVASHFPN